MKQIDSPSVSHSVGLVTGYANSAVANATAASAAA